MSPSNVNSDPDLRLAGLSIWVHGYQFADAKADSDANWLFVTARCVDDGSTVQVTGSIMSTTDFESLAADCERLYSDLKGEAVCDP